MPNTINHQVSIAMASKIAKTLTTVKPNPSQILVLSLLLDRRMATNQTLSKRDPIHSPQRERNQNSQKPFDPPEIGFNLSKIARRHVTLETCLWLCTSLCCHSFPTLCSRMIRHKSNVLTDVSCDGEA